MSVAIKAHSAKTRRARNAGVLTPSGARLRLDEMRSRSGGPYAALTDAQVRAVAVSLDRIEAARGHKTPEDVVRAARTDPALRGLFEWDNAVAGHRHRLEQARELIVTVMVRIESPEGAQSWVRRYWPVRTKTEEGDTQTSYRPIETMLAEQDSEADMKARCVAEIARAMNPYLALAPVFGWTHRDINQVVQKRLGMPLPAPPAEARVLSGKEIADLRRRKKKGETVAMLANRFGITERAVRVFAR